MKVLLISENNKILEVASTFQTLKQRDVFLVTFKSNLVKASQKIANEIPDVVVIDVNSQNIQELELIDRYKSQYKNMTFMMLSEDTSSELLLKAIRSGFSEVIPSPLNEQVFTSALERFQNRTRVNSTFQTKVLSVISCKGGSGATFIATNLAYEIAETFNKKVLLIDANQYFGDASLYVSDMKAPMTLADVCNQISRLDYSFLESSLIEVTPRFKILAAAENPASANDVHPDHLETIVRISKNYYDYIFIDLGRQIDGLSVKAMDLSDHIYPVLQLILPYIRDARHLQDVFKSLGYNSNKVQFIINRYEKNSKLQLSDVSNALNITPAFTLPNEYGVATESINNGVAVSKQSPNSAISRTLKEIGKRITGIELKESSLFSKLFK